MSRPGVTLLTGDCRDVLKTLPDESVQCCVTSPPYWGLRSYLPDGHPDKEREIGTEKTPELYVAHLVEVFREVRRVLRKDGVLWLNLGDSYCSTAPGTRNAPMPKGSDEHAEVWANLRPETPLGLKPKDLVGIPWRVAFALQADGWWLRSEITWVKRAPMPESVTDRPTSATEKVFLFAKSAKYFYDAEAVKERSNGSTGGGFSRATAEAQLNHGAMRLDRPSDNGYRNMRNYWILGPEPYREAHFATFPTKLVRPCILAGTSERGACPTCGAPWERVAGQPEPAEGRGSGNVERKIAKDGERSRLNTHMGSSVPWSPSSTPTVGWRPTCDCPGPDGDHPGSDCADYDEWPTVPCVVLDPFAGSGTVGVVAKRLGRDAVLIDLNPVYVEELARPRIERTQPCLEGIGG